MLSNTLSRVNSFLDHQDGGKAYKNDDAHGRKHPLNSQQIDKGAT